MKKITSLTLTLLMVLSLAACGEKKEPAGTEAPVSQAQASEAIAETTEAAETEAAATEAAATEAPAEAVSGVCTPEAYDEAIAALTVTTGAPTRTYADVVALFGGVEGTVNTEMKYEGYSYYDWTDGKRTALLTFKVKGEEETYFAITGDIQ